MFKIKNMGCQIISSVVEKGSYAAVKCYLSKVRFTKVSLQLIDPVLPLYCIDFLLIRTVSRSDEFSFRFSVRSVSCRNRTHKGGVLHQFLAIEINKESESIIHRTKSSFSRFGDH